MPLTQVDQGLLSSTAQYTGFKNRIINGAMVIDQRNNGSSYTPTNSAPFITDRWGVFQSAAGKVTGQQSSVAPSGFNNSLLITSSSAYSVGAAEAFQLYQRIEGFNVSDLGFGAAGASSITISFWIRCSLTGTFGGYIGNSDQSRIYPFSFIVNSANTWEQKTVTIAGDTSGTWNKTTSTGIILVVNLGNGTNYQGATGAWGASTVLGPVGGVNLVGTNGATFYITGVQLEKGSIATAFDYRPYGTELALCQRYWERIGYGSDIVIGGYQVTNGLIYVSFSHAVPKRNPPTVLKLGTWTVSSSTQPTVSSPTTWGFRVYITANATGTIYALNDSPSLYFSSDAEL